MVTSISGVVVHVVSSGSVVVVEIVVEVVVVEVVVVLVVLTAIQVSFFSFSLPSLHFTSVIVGSLKNTVNVRLVRRTVPQF